MEEKTQLSVTGREAATSASFLRLYRIIETLRSPAGCPWDREQSVATLRDSLIEECYECVEAVTDSDPGAIREELGDVFLIATMMSFIEEQSGEFTLSDVLEEVSEKLVRRHPHVFATSSVSTPDEVITQWNAIKAKERLDAGERTALSVLDRVSKALPPLRLAWELQKKAAKVGFDWPDRSGILAKLDEELAELAEAEQLPDSDLRRHAVEEEIGDLLFTVVNLSRVHGIEPDVALLRTSSKFRKRFTSVELGMARQGLKMNASNLDAMDALWTSAKERSEEGGEA